MARGPLRRLAGRGFRVVRFDNRDVGRSTHLSGPGISAWGFLTRRARPVYTLADMADDTGGLIARVAPSGAHVVGASLGASVAQETAIPPRPGPVADLGDGPPRRRHRADRAADAARVPAPPPADPVEGLVRSFRRIGSHDRTAVDDEDVRVTFRRAQARETGDGSGAGRQLAAIVAERDRTADLRALTCPALVLHGCEDRVIRPDGGRATAAAVPGAELVEVPGMGHDLPRWVWPELVEGIARTAARAHTR
ncbi:alpha/beta fold hydrolase [Pseudonocardia sp. ICBG1034]|uniref:alpha/beta fold hydrolase n=1 Tax=Pseudonocardia sp. ICBG1034 TaxID=2844381 RepID=UPI001CCDB760|nr:alpha/beta hydrolase [Pseudonocardia sp. ICBG1034]